MDRKDLEGIEKKALQQFKSGKSLFGKDGPLWRKSSRPARAGAKLGRSQTARKFLTQINKANGQIFLSLSNVLQVKRLMLNPTPPRL